VPDLSEIVINHNPPPPLTEPLHLQNPSTYRTPQLTEPLPLTEPLHLQNPSTYRTPPLTEPLHLQNPSTYRTVAAV